MEKIRFERELYEPLRQYLQDRGFEVRSEVNACDLVARKPGRLVVVELKRHLSFDLLVQAIERQGYADAVYVAIPKPPRFKMDKDWRARLRVLRQLGLGLLLVGRLGERYLVEEALAAAPAAMLDTRMADTADSASGIQPPGMPEASAASDLLEPFRPRKPVRPSPKKRRSLEREFDSRSLDLNVAGTRGVPLVTAYRESALHVAFLLDRNGPQTPKSLRELGGHPQKTPGILRLNPYGWFVKTEGHTYALSAVGREALQTYAPLVDAFREAAVQSLAQLPAVQPVPEPRRRRRKKAAAAAPAEGAFDDGISGAGDAHAGG